MYPICSGSLRAPRPALTKCIKQWRLCRHMSASNSPSNFHEMTRRRKTISNDSQVFRISDEVRDAVLNDKPVVALETTIYTHGFPYPDNLALATHLESVVRLNGGIPATIGVLNGVATVGLSPEELVELVCPTNTEDIMKISRRDLPYITGLGLTGRKINGGTTIASTVLLANMASISVFGTGGLGGVHRGGESTMDISADLQELGRTAVAVISSGCKSFLDIPRTLEYLETQGVCVATFADGRTGNVDFPAFWTRESGVRSPKVVQNEQEAAAIIYASLEFGAQSNGLLFANPIPEEWSLLKSDMDAAIEAAVSEAAEKGFHGHRNTPFILDRIKELTGGKSVPANKALVESNVALATKIAVQLAWLKQQSQAQRFSSHTPLISNDRRRYAARQTASEEKAKPIHIKATATPLTSSVQMQESSVTSGTLISPEPEINILVAGSVAVDVLCDYSPFDQLADPMPLLHTSHPAAIKETVGGVGLNVALAAQQSSQIGTVQLCSFVATDTAGQLILSDMATAGLKCDGIRALTANQATRTARYVAVNDKNKGLYVAMADMDIIGNARDDFKMQWQPTIDAAKPQWVVVDANWHASTFMQWVAAANAAGAKVAFEPVSVPKSQILFSEPLITGTTPLPVFPDHAVHLATPNIDELKALHVAAQSRSHLERQDWWAVIDALGIPSTGARDRMVQLTSTTLVDTGIPQMSIQLLPFIPTIITKLGIDGCLVTELLAPDSPKLTSPDHAPYILSRSNNGTDFIGGVYMRHFPAEPLGTNGIVSVNGAGDTFLGVLLAGLVSGLPVDEALIGVAQKAAVLTLGGPEPVSPMIQKLVKPELEKLAGYTSPNLSL